MTLTITLPADVGGGRVAGGGVIHPPAEEPEPAAYRVRMWC